MQHVGRGLPRKPSFTGRSKRYSPVGTSRAEPCKELRIADY
jgi:hypothetical protein